MPLFNVSPTFGTVTLTGVPLIVMGTTSATQLTVGASGLSTASALPLFPNAYLKIQNSTGTSLVIPVYAAS